VKEREREREREYRERKEKGHKKIKKRGDTDEGR
jgi:hypothetical protein